MRTIGMVVVAAALQGCVFYVAPLEQETDTLTPVGAFDRVIVHGEVGDVTVRVGEPEIDVTARWRGEEPTWDAEVDGGVLTVSTDCPPRFGRCEVDLVVWIPVDSAVDLDIGTGDVAVSDVTGDVRVEVGTGDVDLYDLVGDVLVDVGTGDTRLVGLAGDVEHYGGTGHLVGEELASAVLSADLGTGGVDLTFVAVPDAVSIHVGTGDVDLVLPDGTYAVDADAGTGDVDVDVVDDPDGECTIDVRTGTGDIHIR